MKKKKPLKPVEQVYIFPVRNPLKNDYVFLDKKFFFFTKNI